MISPSVAYARTASIRQGIKLCSGSAALTPHAGRAPQQRRRCRDRARTVLQALDLLLLLLGRDLQQVEAVVLVALREPIDRRRRCVVHCFTARSKSYARVGDGALENSPFSTPGVHARRGSSLRRARRGGAKICSAAASMSSVRLSTKYEPPSGIGDVGDSSLVGDELLGALARCGPPSSVGERQTLRPSSWCGSDCVPPITPASAFERGCGRCSTPAAGQ